MLREFPTASRLIRPSTQRRPPRAFSSNKIDFKHLRSLSRKRNCPGRSLILFTRRNRGDALLSPVYALEAGRQSIFSEFDACNLMQGCLFLRPCFIKKKYRLSRIVSRCVMVSVVCSRSHEAVMKQ